MKGLSAKDIPLIASSAVTASARILRELEQGALGTTGAKFPSIIRFSLYNLGLVLRVYENTQRPSESGW